MTSFGLDFKLVAGATVIFIGGVSVGYFVAKKYSSTYGRYNYKIKLDSDKVVDSQDIEDVGEKRAYCRCWQSQNFPYCDGSHNQHNKLTGDNLGPLIISNKKPSQES